MYKYAYGDDINFMTERMVRDRNFRTESDYQAALRDDERIEQLKKRYNMNNASEVKAILEMLHQGKIRFATIIGNDFCEELEELYDNLLLKDQKQDSEDKKSKKIVRAKSKNKTSKKSVNKSMNNASKYKDAISQDIEEEVQKILKKKALLHKFIIVACSIIGICSLVYFFKYNYDAIHMQNTSNELSALIGTRPVAEVTVNKDVNDYEIPEILDEYKNLYIKNKNLIGWLKIDDTDIDYPVMQTSNNDYYLNHNFEGEEDKNGSLFLDMNCDAVMRNMNMIIYGHHMKSGKMFGGLHKYSDESYCKNHSFIQFDTIYEKSTYQIMYVFKDQVRSESDVNFKYYQFFDVLSEEEFNSNMQEMAKKSLFETGVTAVFGDQLLTLSTCDSSTEAGRFVVVAKRVE